MKNNIKKASVKFWEDLLYFSAFYADFCLCTKSVIITTLTLYNVSKRSLKYSEVTLDKKMTKEITKKKKKKKKGRKRKKIGNAEFFFLYNALLLNAPY